MVGKLALALYAVFSGAVGQPAAEDAEGDKPFFFRTYEHPSPLIREYRLGGMYGKRADQPFVVDLRYDGQWDVRLERTGRPPVMLRLDKAYNAIPVNRIMVAADGDDENLILLIPFGAAHTECFANGAEVYSQIVIGSGERAISLEDFKDCAVDEVLPPLKHIDGVISVGPPPQAG
jgi:hypothetical protein